jgi:hypothetical protein
MYSIGSSSVAVPDRTQRPSSACWIPPSLVEDLIQSRVERTGRAARQIGFRLQF